MTRLARKPTGATRLRSAAPLPMLAARPSFVMVGDEKITRPAEVNLILLYRDTPEERRPAFMRLLENVAGGMPARQAMIAFWTETGGTEEDGARVADSILASQEAQA